MGTGLRKTLKERAFEAALEGAIHVVIWTADAFHLARKIKLRYKPRRKR